MVQSQPADLPPLTSTTLSSYQHEPRQDTVMNMSPSLHSMPPVQTISPVEVMLYHDREGENARRPDPLDYIPDGSYHFQRGLGV